MRAHLIKTSSEPPVLNRNFTFFFEFCSMRLRKKDNQSTSVDNWTLLNVYIFEFKFFIFRARIGEKGRIPNAIISPVLLRIFSKSFSPARINRSAPDFFRPRLITMENIRGISG